MQRLVKVDGKTRVDKCYPAGFMGACPLHSVSASQAERVWCTGARTTANVSRAGRMQGAWAAGAIAVGVAGGVGFSGQRVRGEPSVEVSSGLGRSRNGCRFFSIGTEQVAEDFFSPSFFFPQTSSPSTRPTSTSASSTTRRAASSFTALLRLRLR